MNKFIKRAIIVILTELIIILAVNILVNRKESEDRPYIVEIKRAAAMIKETGKIPALIFSCICFISVSVIVW